jgi:hypothetical protein
MQLLRLYNRLSCSSESATYSRELQTVSDDITGRPTNKTNNMSLKSYMCAYICKFQMVQIVIHLMYLDWKTQLKFCKQWFRVQYILTFEAFPWIMLYGTSLAKLLSGFCPPLFFVQYYSRVSFRYVVWLQYCYVTDITLLPCNNAKDGEQKFVKKFCQKSVIHSYLGGGLFCCQLIGYCFNSVAAAENAELREHFHCY